MSKLKFKTTDLKITELVNGKEVEINLGDVSFEGSIEELSELIGTISESVMDKVNNPEKIMEEPETEMDICKQLYLSYLGNNMHVNVNGHQVKFLDRSTAGASLLLDGRFTDIVVPRGYTGYGFSRIYETEIKPFLID